MPIFRQDLQITIKPQFTMKTKLIALIIVAVITVSFTFIKKGDSQAKKAVPSNHHDAALIATDHNQFN
jgi:hypothetical protein